MESDPDNDQLQWYCLRTQPKREHIAMAHIAKEPDLEAFCPRVRFQRLTARGKVWFTEAMFPNYIFARFDWERQFRQVNGMLGVNGVLHFGEFYPPIPDAMITELREYLDESDLKVFQNELQQGDEVILSDGPMMGFRAVVTQLLPARMRVRVLLEFLGQPTVAEVSVEKVHKDSFLE